ncbi:MAG: DUF1592 domain-containing protein [Myxococcota bacterium]
MTRLAPALLLLASCNGLVSDVGDGEPGTGTPPPTAPAPQDLRQPPDPATCAVPAERIWKLTPAQYVRSLEALIPQAEISTEAIASSISTTTRFENNNDQRPMTLPHVEALFNAASAAADAAIANPTDLHSCLGDGLDDDACIGNVIEDFGAKAYRRPLTAEETSDLTSFFATEAGAYGRENGLHQLVRRILLSPDFLYRTELGDSGDPEFDLTPYERASALSYFLTDQAPDSELFAAAESGALADVTEMESQARRLLATADGALGIRNFFREYLHTESVAGVNKDEERFPDFNTDVSADMALETEAFIEHVIWEGNGSYTGLLSAPYTVVNERLANFYGYDGVQGNNFQRVDTEGRAGILSLGAFLATQATFTDSNIVYRGHFVQEEILCGTIPPPPPEVSDDFAAPMDGQTQRQFLEERHSNDSTCFGCHRLMDPIGFAFEHFDAVGRYRELDNGLPIDPSGEIVDVDLEDRTFSGPVELANRLAEAPEARQCFIKRMHEYTAGQAPSGLDACSLYELNSAFEASNGDVRELIVSLVSNESFFRRSRLDR